MSGITVFNTNEVETKKQPMFFGQPLGVQRYDGSKYPVFEKLTQQQLGYFWRPEEVSLQKDRSDYQNLSPEQKHIFTGDTLLVFIWETWNHFEPVFFHPVGWGE